MMRALIKISVQDVNQVIFPFCLGVTERPRCNRFCVGDAVERIFIWKLCDRV